MEDRLDRIIAGKGTFKKVPLKGGDTYQIKELHDHIFCADGTKVSVQASHTHYCTPRNDTGPYTRLEVGYPSADPPEAWAKYADGEYPSDVYGYVPVAMIREFIEAHGGEASRQTQAPAPGG